VYSPSGCGSDLEMATEMMSAAQPGHRRVRSEPFDFDEPDQDDILAVLSVPDDNWHKKAEAAIHAIQQSTQDSELAQLEEYAKPSRGIDAPDDSGLRTISWDNSPPLSRSAVGTGAGSPDLSGRLNSVTLDEFPTASPRTVDSVWGEIDSWMVGASSSRAEPTEMPSPPAAAAATSTIKLSEPAPEPAPYGMVAMGVTLRSWHDEPIQGEQPLGTIATVWDRPSSAASTEESTTPPGQKRMRIPGGSPRKVKRTGNCQRASSAPPAALASSTTAAVAPSSSSSSTTPPPPAMGEPSMGEPPALMEKPLPSEIAYRMLTDDGYQPGARPLSFDGLDGRWVFKEDSRDRGPNARHKIDKKADRWHNSGGVRGARDMPTERPLVRRRYGSVSRGGTILWRFHEYSLVKRVEDPASEDGYRMDEDRATTVFHVMPKRAGRGRPSKAEADLPALLWKQFGFAN
jgi:hypothetical protein